MRNLFFIIGLIFLVACQGKPIYQEQLILEDAFWTYNESLTFETDIEDVESNYALNLVIDHSDNYPFQNIYLRIKTVFPDEKITEEQLSIDLAEKSGKWQGKCRSGSCKIKVYLLESFKFPERGKYQFIFEQYTRSESLEGVNSLALSLHKEAPKS